MDLHLLVACVNATYQFPLRSRICKAQLVGNLFGIELLKLFPGDADGRKRERGERERTEREERELFFLFNKIRFFIFLILN